MKKRMILILMIILLSNCAHENWFIKNNYKLQDVEKSFQIPGSGSFSGIAGIDKQKIEINDEILLKLSLVFYDRDEFSRISAWGFKFQEDENFSIEKKNQKIGPV